MHQVLFELNLQTHRGYIGPYWDVINAIRELLFPGLYNLDKKLLEKAKHYEGTEAWHMLFALGPHHDFPFYYNSGVVSTCSRYTLNQLTFTRDFGR